MPSAKPRKIWTKGSHGVRAFFAAGLLLGVASLSHAQLAGTEKADAPISGELRTDEGADSSNSIRSDERLTPPYSIDRDQLSQLRGGENGTGDDDDPGADTSEEGEEGEEGDRSDGDGSPSPPPRPRIDLFEESPSDRTLRQSLPSEPAAPSTRARPLRGTAAREQTGRRDRGPRNGRDTSDARATAGLRGTLPERGETSAPDEEDSIARARPSPRFENRLTLPAAPIRSSLTPRPPGEPGLTTGALRGTLSSAVNDPFASVGLRLGSLVLFAALDQSVGYSDNLEQTPNGTAGAFSETTLSTRFVSDWSRHAAELEAIASYRRNFAGELASDPDVTVNGLYRIDIDRLTVANLRGGFIYRRESGEDLDSPLTADQTRPTLLNYSAGADLEHQFGDAFARGTVSAVRETTDRSGEGSIPDEDYDTYVGTLRAGYRLSPALAPFVEGSVGRRLFDREADLTGTERASTLAALRGGVSFDFGEKLNGEIAAGNGWNLPDADTIGTVSRPTLDARIAWSPQRGTDVALIAATTFEPETATSATSTVYQIGLAGRHRATARLDLQAGLSAGYRDGQSDADSQRTWGASAGFTYWLNRTLAVIGLASHDDVDRLHIPGDYTVNSIRLGLRLLN